MSKMDDIDRRIVVATQSGLPLQKRPYLAIAEAIGVTEKTVIDRMRAMLENGTIRRIGAVPNHYALGLRGNGMSVWDVDDDLVGELGRQVGALDFVSHCYHRPRRGELWPYNLFAMVHGRDRPSVQDKVRAIARLIGPAARRHDVLFSKRILKKSGLRLVA